MGNSAGRCVILIFCLKGQQSFQINQSKQRSIFRVGIATENVPEVKPSISEGEVIPPLQSVWTVFGELSAKTDSSNLGQGFPDWDPPSFLLDSLRDAVDSKFHQYTRPAGYPPLVKLLGAKYSDHFNRPVDALEEVAVTVGASQALYLALTLFLKANDEVVLFEPFFDLYGKQIQLTGAIPKYVSLGGKSATAADPWALDIALIKAAITSETKMLILNSPHNPTGKVFTLAEMEAIAEIVRAHPNLIVISDEVYKFSVYNPLEEGDSSSIGHYHFSRLPGMFDRTITLSSCGKTFSCTGWQVGWIVGPSKYIKPIQELLPCVQFCASTPIQHALTSALQIAEKPYLGQPSYYEWLRQQFYKKREILEEGLRAVGIEPLMSHGGFFMMGRLPYYEDLEIVNDLQHISIIGEKEMGHESEPYDWRFCRKLAIDYGVVAIPTSSFFTANSSTAETLGPLARFAFCKKDETLIGARDRLIAYAEKHNIVGLVKPEIH
jgi:kynurenine--oxoglutarate transaminase/cysteine-S-conjugate beta-lyase/glutamine--phenylpyruvate transaminase